MNLGGEPAARGPQGTKEGIPEVDVGSYMPKLRLTCSQLEQWESLSLKHPRLDEDTSIPRQMKSPLWTTQPG
jgi:hypothetical protein